MGDTRDRLLAATLETLRERGIAGLSARTVAATAGVNQALVFYHFGSMDQLIAAACHEGALARAETYRTRFAQVGSLGDLLALGRALHEEERQQGNVTVMAQVLAGAQSDRRLAVAGKAALDLWIAEIEPVLQRLLARSPVAEALDVPGLARGVAASFVGIELYDAVDPAAATSAFDALERLAVLMDVVDDLGPAARAAVRRRLRRRAT